MPSVAASWRFIVLTAAIRAGRSATAYFFTKFGGKFGDLCVTAELQRPDVSDDGPAVTRGYLRRVAIHLAKTIGDDVVEVAGWRPAQAVLMIGRRALHTAHGDHAVAVAL